VVIHPITTGRTETVAGRAKSSLSVVVVVMMMMVIVVIMVVLLETGELNAIYIGDTRNTTQTRSMGHCDKDSGKQNMIFTALYDFQNVC
jgi:predicted metalloprotease